MATLSTLKMYGRFMIGLPQFLRRPPMTLEDAKDAVRRGLAQRETNFLGLVRRGIFANHRSPYRPLLELAGCEFGDIESSVRANGLEATLEELRRAGVYFTFEEYKGREPVVRGGRTIEVGEHDFDNPLTSKAFEGETGGSTGAGTRVETDLDNLFSQAPHLMLARSVHGLLGRPMAVWHGALPDPTGVGIYMRAVTYRGHPVRWFTPVTRELFKPALKYRLATQYVLAMSRLCGLPCPRPQPVRLEDAVIVARWAADAVRVHGACEVVCSVSLAVRICLAARDEGIDLSGAAFLGGGEPFTAAKNAVITSVGGRYVSIYISEYTGPMGIHCAAPLEENDQHLLEDAIALIQHPREVLDSGVEVEPFYMTTLRPMASKIFLNVESDDYGIVEERSCGCPLEELGYHRHVRQIRSFGKLTGEGVTLVGSEMVRVLEEVLPNAFKGSPQDFQLVEEQEDGTGFTRLSLLIHPALEIPREEDVIETMLEALGEGSVSGGLARTFWRQADTFRIRRQKPIWTARGKLPSIRRADVYGAREQKGADDERDANRVAVGAKSES